MSRLSIVKVGLRSIQLWRKLRKVQHHVKRLVLDVLKLRRDHPLDKFALHLGSIPDVKGMKVSLVETDQETETVKVTLEGENIDVGLVQKMMKDHVATVHSIDEVVAGKENALWTNWFVWSLVFFLSIDRL